MSEKRVKLDELGRPVLDQFSEEGFVDCTFLIAEVSSDPTHHRVRLVASYDGAAVGFGALIRRGIRAGFDSELNLIPEHVYRPAVEFTRSGPESDELVTVLSALHGRPAQNLRMVDAVSFTGIALHQDDIDLERQPVKLKLFGRDSDAEVARGEYFESFFTVDLQSGFVFWNEKDPVYRVPLIRGLTVAR